MIEPVAALAPTKSNAKTVSVRFFIVLIGLMTIVDIS